MIEDVFLEPLDDIVKNNRRYDRKELLSLLDEDHIDESLIRSGFDLPFGASRILLARKK